MTYPQYFQEFVNFTRQLYKAGENVFIPLHAPVFAGNEKKYVSETIDSTFVSSVGAFVNQAEDELAKYTGAACAIATGNGTLALHAALVLAGVQPGDEVLLQPLTFVATGNAIKYCFAHPVFVDVDKDTAGMSAESLEEFLTTCTHLNNDGNCVHTSTGRIIRACVPMHTFGLPCRIAEIAALCQKHNIVLVEDSAESIGSYADGIHTGRYGKLGILSFNGNKTITCGGGGAIITDDETLGKHAKHITTTAKKPHPWEFWHDEVGYNYRMPNLNAALLVAQLEMLPEFLKNKRETADAWFGFCQSHGIAVLQERKDAKSNYWLNAILLKNREERDHFLEYTNSRQVMTRPAWTLLPKMPPFSNDFVFADRNAKWLEDRIVNIPSSYRPE
ncbi:MAG: LegC family aminotransferase [Bacteroidetes bacterium]|nr:LegC family aminotransferase [Bacteroidota bacterium]